MMAAVATVRGEFPPKTECRVAALLVNDTG